MTVKLADAITHLEHALDGDPADLIKIGLVNEAGEHMVQMHDWEWSVRPPVFLDLRANVNVSGATWTESTKTLSGLTLTGYSFFAGDRFEATSGTGLDAIGSSHQIASAGASSIVLETSIGAGADGQTDIAGVIHADALALPADIRDIIAIQSTDSLSNSLELVSRKELIDYRTRQVPIANRWFRGAVVTAQLAAGAPVPRLEIYPAPSANETATMSLIYRAGWTELTGAEVDLAMPPWMGPLFFRLVRAVAKGYEEDNDGDLSDRIEKIAASYEFRSAVARDGAMQPHMGMMSGGAVQGRRGYVRWHTTTTNLMNPN